MLSDSIKQPKNAQLYFEFIEEKSLLEELESITILNEKIYVNNKNNYYFFNLSDKSYNEYKVYEIFFCYKSSKISHYITVYYNKKNYYICGRNKNINSIEIIFVDFISNNIDINRCYITYKNNKYYSSNKDINDLITRKRINLLNINLSDLELPKDLKSQNINIDNLDEKSYLIIISVSEIIPKVIGIYLNLPVSERKDIEIDKYLKEVTEKVAKVKKYFNYNNNISFEEYQNFKGLENNIFSEYSKDLKESIIIEKNLDPFFDFFRPKLNQKEMQLYDAYSDFLITFPKLKDGNVKMNYFFYWEQYYYSQKAIYNFMKTIPKEIEEEEKIKLKYSACRCLRTMLLNGDGENDENLFYFFDVNSKNTIYNDAKVFNLQFIDSLKETSEIFLFLLQTNSGISVNKLTGKLSARLSMLNHEQVKDHLKMSLPNYIIRVNFKTFFNAISFTETKITFLSEISLLGSFQKKEGLESCKDIYYSKRYLLANLMGHEDFDHIKFSINSFSFKLDQTSEKYLFHYMFEKSKQPLSPIEYYNVNVEKEKNIEIKVTETKNGITFDKGELGIAFNFFLTRGNIKLIDVLRRRKMDFTDIFKSPKLLAKDDLKEYIDLLKKIAENLDDDYISYSISEESQGKYQINCINEPIPTTTPTICKFSFI